MVWLSKKEEKVSLQNLTHTNKKFAIFMNIKYRQYQKNVDME